MGHLSHAIPLEPSARALWRRAADELLIDAIFGNPPEIQRNTVQPSPQIAPRERRGSELQSSHIGLHASTAI